MSTVQQGGNSATPAASKSWIARHKFLTFLGLLLIVILVVFYFLGWPLVKLRFHSQYVMALNEIRSNPAVVERLGQPIETVRPFPGGSVTVDGDRGEAMFYFDVAGPKGTANVSVKSRLLQSQWGFTQLELEFPDKQRLDLAQNAKQHSGDDTPKFDPNAKQPEVKAPDLPVDIKLPDLPEMPKK
jgi:hypothetical protein